jgi:hypothetical protein
MKESDLKSSLEALSLQEVILARQGSGGPATHKHHESNKPIDGIWTTPGLYNLSGGYFSFDQVFPNTDHQCLWIDLSFVNAFGHCCIS